MARAKAKEQGPDGKPAIDVLQLNRMISKEELATFLDVPEGTLDQWASRGGGPPFHGIGNHRKYLPADVREWLKTRRREVSSDARGAA
jgi:hypothetical protein